VLADCAALAEVDAAASGKTAYARLIDVAWSRIPEGSRVSPCKILFYFKALLWESIILLLALPHLQSLPYCNTIGRPFRNIRPPPTPLSYAIHHTILAMAISCKGQVKRREDTAGVRELRREGTGR